MTTLSHRTRHIDARQAGKAAIAPAFKQMESSMAAHPLAEPIQKRSHGSHKQVQKGFLTRRSPWLRYYYAKSGRMRGLANRATSGMGWNWYMTHGKTTPSTHLATLHESFTITKTKERVEKTRSRKASAGIHVPALGSSPGVPDTHHTKKSRISGVTTVRTDSGTGQARGKNETFRPEPTATFSGTKPKTARPAISAMVVIGPRTIIAQDAMPAWGNRPPGTASDGLDAWGLDSRINRGNTGMAAPGTVSRTDGMANQGEDMPTGTVGAGFGNSTTPGTLNPPNMQPQKTRGIAIVLSKPKHTGASSPTSKATRGISAHTITMTPVQIAGAANTPGITGITTNPAQTTDQGSDGPSSTPCIIIDFSGNLGASNIRRAQNRNALGTSKPIRGPGYLSSVPKRIKLLKTALGAADLPQ